MTKASREFQVFAKPTGSLCNLRCHYCYYLEKETIYEKGESSRMADDVLEEYILQHIDASATPLIRFSWHGGEPTLLGVDYFRKVVALQRKHQPPGRRISNGIQTNGTLLDEEWCRFLASEGFSVGISMDGSKELHDLYRVSKRQAPTHEQAMRGYMLLRQHGIASWLSEQPEVKKVYYPGLPSHPGRDLHFRQASGPGAVISFELANAEGTRSFLRSVTLPLLAPSLGGVESILSYPSAMSHAFVPPEERLARGVTDSLVRLSVGLEDPEDMIADFHQALRKGDSGK